MENASKALLISGAVLIGILLLSFAVYLSRIMASGTERLYERLEASEISEFNQKFLVYDGRGETRTYYDAEGNPYTETNPLTIQDVATIVNLAIDSNNNNKDLQKKIEVYLEKGCYCSNTPHVDWAKKYENNVNKILEEHMADVKNDQKFSCKVEQDPNTTYVQKVTITKIP